MRRYAELITARREQIIEAYRAQCEYLLRIEYSSDAVEKISGLGSHGMRHQLLTHIVKNPNSLYVAVQPVLLIFGFDEAQRDHDGWQKHLTKLNESLPKNRIIARGNSSGIRLGSIPPQDGEVWKPD
jgi:hypothetical protein